MFWSMELKLSYTLPREGEVFKEDTDDKEKLSLWNKVIQDIFYAETGLKVDTQKCGYGNRNYGNTYLSFFRNSEDCSLITGILMDIIRRILVILNILNCKKRVNGTKHMECWRRSILISYWLPHFIQFWHTE